MQPQPTATPSQLMLAGASAQQSQNMPSCRLLSVDDDTSKHKGVQRRSSELGQNIRSTEATLDEVAVTEERESRPRGGQCPEPATCG